VYEIDEVKCSTNIQGTDGNTKWRMRIACWVPKTTNTHSQYVILIAFRMQQWLRERALMLRYTYIFSLVVSIKIFPFEIQFEMK
jgi:hypothetical protein